MHTINVSIEIVNIFWINRFVRIVHMWLWINRFVRIVHILEFWMFTNRFNRYSDYPIRLSISGDYTIISRMQSKAKSRIYTGADLTIWSVMIRMLILRAHWAVAVSVVSPVVIEPFRRTRAHFRYHEHGWTPFLKSYGGRLWHYDESWVESCDRVLIERLGDFLKSYGGQIWIVIGDERNAHSKSSLSGAEFSSFLRSGD